jgi:hypothetical protein
MSTIRKFVVSAANVWGYAENGDLMFEGKTLLDTSLEASLNANDIRAGRGNALVYTYYSTAELNVQISDAQWNLDLLAQNVGSDILTGNNVFFEETVTLGADGAGTVTKTPLALFGAAVLGWITLASGVVEKVTFTGSNFSCAGAEGDVVTARYYMLDSASRSIVVKSDMVPAISYLVMEAQLCSSDVATNVIGKIEIRIPRASMQGNFSISMTPDGVASTPLSVRALSSTQTINGVATQTYAIITESITSSHWYDNVVALAIVGGNQALATTLGTKTLEVRAVPTTGAPFRPPYADIDFVSGTVGVATIGANTGTVQGVSAGTTLITATIHDKTSVEVQCTITVPS